MHRKRHHSRSGWKTLTGDLLIAAVIAFTVYLAVVTFNRIISPAQAAANSRRLLIEGAICGLFLLLTADLRFGFLGRIPTILGRIAGWTIRILAIAAAAVVLFMTGRVILTGIISHPEESEYAVVLGLAQDQGLIGYDLIQCVDTARDYAETHPEATLILAGGAVSAAGESEAAAMQGLLAQRGFPVERTILEERSASVAQSFRSVAGLIDPAKPVIVVTSDYHALRAWGIAQEAGFEQVKLLPAPSALRYYGARVMWEVSSELDGWLSRIRSAAVQQEGC